MLGTSIGLRGLLTARQAMDLLGQNVANFATDGYSRRTLTLRTTDPLSVPGVGFFGTGVQLGEVRRVHDALLIDRLRTETSLWSRASTEFSQMRLLETSFDESAGTGLGQAFDRVFGSFSSLLGGTEDPARRSEVVSELELLTSGFGRLAGDLRRLEGDLVVGLQESVLDTNSALERVAEVNRRILTESGASPPAALLDELDRALSTLSEHVDVQVVVRDRGAVDVLSGGELLVSGPRPAAIRLRSAGAGGLRLEVEGRDFEPEGGRLAALSSFAAQFLDDPKEALDEIARDLALAVNRIHTTAVPDGGYSSLIAEVRPEALTEGADVRTLALADLDLGVDLQQGRVVVNLVDRESGRRQQSVIEVDPRATTLQDFADALDAVGHLSASLDSDGRMRLVADAGWGLDFSNRLDEDPDDAGSFGSASAQLSSSAGPYRLADGDRITVSVDGGPEQEVVFSSADFEDIANATAAEVAAVLDAQVGGARAQAVDGRIVLRSESTGRASSLQASEQGGTALAELGLDDGLEIGQDVAVEVRLEGAPTAEDFGPFEVRALGSGTIGSTEGLQVEVLDGEGRRLTVLDVGADYTPGDPLQIVPGVDLHLGAGEISAVAGDFFGFETFADGDSSDVLVGLGLGTLVRGRDAASLAVVDRIADDPGRLGADTASVLELSGLVDDPRLRPAYTALVASVGRASASVQARELSGELLVSSLSARRQELSGVNLDEEMLKLVEMEQLYAASARYLQVVNETTQSLMELI